MIDKILSERKENYGDFEDNAFLSQHLKACVRGNAGYEKLNTTQTEAMEMILHKIARIINGNPDYVDSWVDITGYVQLVVNSLKND